MGDGNAYWSLAGVPPLVKNTSLEAQQAVDVYEVRRLIPLTQERILHLIKTQPSKGHQLVAALKQLAWE